MHWTGARVWVHLWAGQQIAQIIPGDGLPRLSAKWNEYEIKLCLLSEVIGHLCLLGRDVARVFLTRLFRPSFPFRPATVSAGNRCRRLRHDKSVSEGYKNIVI